VTGWRKSSRCSGGNCVEARPVGDEVRVRDSDDPDYELVFSKDEWSSFVAGVQAGEFRFGGEDR
jgi:hypothetical protein